MNLNEAKEILKNAGLIAESVFDGIYSSDTF